MSTRKANPAKYEKQLLGTEISRSAHPSHVCWSDLDERRRICCSQSQSSILNTQCVPVLVPTYWLPLWSEYLFTLHRKCGNRTYPICDAPLSRSARCILAPRYRNWKKFHMNRSLIQMQHSLRITFVQQYSGTVWLSIARKDLSKRSHFAPLKERGVLIRSELEP